MPTPFPECPWQMIGTDLFELDKLNYLIVEDYFSRYIEVAAMQNTTKSHEVIRALKSIFTRHGSTPLACGYSPSELLMDRKLRNTIPTFHTVLNSSWPDLEKLREREAESKEKQRLNFNHRHNAAPLKALQPSFPVHIKDMGTTGTVTRAAETPRSYIIETEKGTVRRNRSHVNSISINKSVSPSVSDKSMSPSVTKQQPQDKALTLLKPLPSPCLSSRPKRLVRPSLKLKGSLGLC